MIESKFLKDDLGNVEKLAGIPALGNLDLQNQMAILRISKIKRFDDDECIIKEGDVDPWLYFLLSGKVRVVKGMVPVCLIGQAGELFGEMRLVDRKNRSASVYAVGQTICLAVDTSAAYRLHSEKEMANIIRLLYQVICKSLSIRLRFSNEQLITAKNEINRLKNGFFA